jgi:hypothetical protein
MSLFMYRSGPELLKALRDLRMEKERLDHAIALLEEFARSHRGDGRTQLAGKRRGRKGMDAKERLEVSKRMKTYWAGRRRSKDKPAGD